jgi:hypothetical protein
MLGDHAFEECCVYDPHMDWEGMYPCEQCLALNHDLQLPTRNDGYSVAISPRESLRARPLTFHFIFFDILGLCFAIKRTTSNALSIGLDLLALRHQ